MRSLWTSVDVFGLHLPHLVLLLVCKPTLVSKHDWSHAFVRVIMMAMDSDYNREEMYSN